MCLGSRAWGPALSRLSRPSIRQVVGDHLSPEPVNLRSLVPCMSLPGSPPLTRMCCFCPAHAAVLVHLMG